MTRDKLNSIFESFNHLRVLIIGDVMIDAYLWGDVTRISPEAPVPVVAVTKREDRLGGAANVALNLQALGATPILCSDIGNDEKSNLFLELLKKQNLSAEGIIKNGNRITTVKTRIIGNNHQMLRVDSEVENDNNAVDTSVLIERIKKIISEQKIDVIIFEDYDKGVITPSLINETVAFAKEKNIPVAVDPKRKNFLSYREVTLLKPNLKELKEGLKIDFDHNNKEELIKAVTAFREKSEIPLILVTLSEKGILVSSEKHNDIIPAHIRDIADVSGAGDTVISVASLCLALNLPQTVIASLSNLAGGLVCESTGVVPVDKSRLFKEACVSFSFD